MIHTSTRKAGRVSLWTLLGISILTVSLLASAGCITTAAIVTIAVLTSSDDEGDYIATAQLDRSPEDVYDAAVRIALMREDVTIDKQDDRRLRLEVSKGLNKATLKISDAGGGASEIIVHATAGEEGAIPMELAHTIVDTLCKELGVTAKWPAE
jgi:hypothetical protein